MIDVSKVLVGSPDQLTTGAVFDAPVGTKIPTSVGAALDEAFKSSGYVTKDGIQLTPDRSTTDITDWGGNTVRTLLDGFTTNISWSEMQMDEDALRHAFGSDAVQAVPATSEHGRQVSLSVGPDLPEPRSWAFKMKDGKARILIVVPNGQVTKVDSISFTSSDAVALPITLSCLPDSSGKTVYIYTDDGVVSA